MSWSELERLVEDAERDGTIGRGLRHCRSRGELVLAACRLGYRICEEDLDHARGLHQQELRGLPARACPVADPAGLAC